MARDLRAAELNNLKLALATFALQLNAFEERLKRRSFETENLSPTRSRRTSELQFAKNILSAMKGAEGDGQVKPG
jgi:hypothetical protein